MSEEEKPKSLRQKHTRRTQKERLEALLSKKPTASLLNSRGIPVEKLNKQLQNVSEVQQNPGQKVKNSKKKRFINKDKPDKANMSGFRKPVDPPKVRDIPTQEWFGPVQEDVEISIIVPMYRSSVYIKHQIESWILETGFKTEIIYVDDGCPERSHQHVIQAWEERKNEVNKPIGKILAHSRNSGFAQACNTGANAARGKYLVFLNADTKVTENWLKPMHQCFSDETVGLVGNLHLKMDSKKVDSLGSEWSWSTKSFVHIGRNIDNGNELRSPYNLEDVPERLMQVRDVQMVTGACFMISKKLFDEVGQFDTGYRVGYWEDSDLNMKIHAHGYRVVCQPKSVIYHKVSHSKVGYHSHMIDNQKLFFSKWVETKLMEGYINNVKPNAKRANVPKNSIVVYTSITGDYDNLKDQPKTATKGTRFVAFMDKKDVQSRTWEIKECCNEFSDPNRNAKIHKVMPHKFFPDYEYSLWIDGSVRIEFPFSVERLAEIYLANHDMAIFKHPDRNCLYQEANTCIQRNLDNPDLIRNQIQRYTKEGYPSNNGLVEATVILRRHSDVMNKFNEAWWEEIKNGSKRDQISFNYVARKMGLKYLYFPGTLRTSNYLFKVGRHKRRR